MTGPLDSQRQEILEHVSGVIRDVIGEEWIRDTPVTMETSFGDDLEFESIEVVALSEKLQEHYGQKIDFVGWLSGMELDEIIDLRVGRLVDFIAASH